jgi:hypothetical protein
MTRQGRRLARGGCWLGHDDASLPDACGLVLVPCGLSPARGAFVSRATYPSGKRREQAYEGHLVDALALRGDEGRSTLR